VDGVEHIVAVERCLLTLDITIYAW